MRLEQFYSFLKIAELQSLRKASEVLFTSPQNLSKSMLSLEEELNTTLFRRTNKGIFLTEQGELAYKDIKEITNKVDAFRSHFCVPAKDNAAPVELLVSYPLDDLSVSALNLLLHDFPEIPIDSHQLDAVSIIKNICSYNTAQKKPDIILTFANQAELLLIEKSASKYYETFFLYKDLTCLQVPKDDPLARRKSIHPQEVSDLPLLLYTSNTNEKTPIEIYYESIGVSLLNVSRTSNLSTCHIMAFNHRKYCVVSYPTAEYRPIANVRYIPLEGLPETSVILLLNKKAENTTFCSAFCDIMDQFYNIRRLF